MRRTSETKMTVLFIRPSTGLTTTTELATLLVSDDQRFLRVHEIGTDEERCFRFQRVFGPAYPLTSVYEEGCLRAVEDVVYGRGSRATIVLGEGKSRLNVALFMLRHAITTFLTQMRHEKALEVTLGCQGDHSTLQQQLLERQVLTGTDSLKVFERSLPGVLKAFSQAQTQVQTQVQTQTSDVSLLVTLHWVGQEDTYRILVGPPNNVVFSQALYKHISTRSVISLRESKLLMGLRDVYPMDLRHGDVQRINVLLCIDFDVIFDRERLRTAQRLLGYAETLIWPVSSSEDEKTAVISASVHYASVEQALKAQAALRDDLTRLRTQLDQTSAALLAEKTRNGLHEKELREKIDRLQAALNDALVINRTLQQEVSLLRGEIRRLQATQTTQDFPPHRVEETLLTTDLQPSRPWKIQERRVSTVDRGVNDLNDGLNGLNDGLNDDSLDGFLLEAARINRELRLRAERIG